MVDFRGSVGEIKTLLGLQHTVINPCGLLSNVQQVFHIWTLTRKGT